MRPGNASASAIFCGKTFSGVNVFCGLLLSNLALHYLSDMNEELVILLLKTTVSAHKGNPNIECLPGIVAVLTRNKNRKVAGLWC
jgi:hypothetical protein